GRPSWLLSSPYGSKKGECDRDGRGVVIEVQQPQNASSDGPRKLVGIEGAENRMRRARRQSVAAIREQSRRRLRRRPYEKADLSALQQICNRHNFSRSGLVSRGMASS